MPSFRTGTVTAILSERPGLQRVEVDGERAYVLTQLTGEVEVGHRVVVNTTAVELGLGTGGWHVVHWDLDRDALSLPGPGHIVKLRYTSLQADTGAAEEREGYDEVTDLRGAPVVACSLHSQVPVVAAAFAHAAPGRRLVYVMTDGAALPIALSDQVHSLRERGLLAATVTAGHAFGGDHEAVSLPSALAVAKGAAGADAVVVGMGPGVVGTGTTLGTTAVEVGAIVAAAAALGGTPVVAVRWGDADQRARHVGVSHHTATAVRLAGAAAEQALLAVPDDAPADVELPAGPRPVSVAVPDVAALLDSHGLRVKTMGRGPDEEPGFFRWAAAAGIVAAAHVHG